MSSNSTLYPPEYENYDSGPHAVRVMTAVIALATLFVGLRISVRLQRRVGLAMDDWLAVASLIVEWAEYADGYLCIKLGGVGRHLPILGALQPPQTCSSKCAMVEFVWTRAPVSAQQPGPTSTGPQRTSRVTLNDTCNLMVSV